MIGFGSQEPAMLLLQNVYGEGFMSQAFVAG